MLRLFQHCGLTAYLCAAVSNALCVCFVSCALAAVFSRFCVPPTTDLPQLYSYSSVKSVVHWFQVMRTGGHLRMFDDGAPSAHRVPSLYDITTMELPIAVFAGGRDTVIDSTKCVVHWMWTTAPSLGCRCWCTRDNSSFPWVSLLVSAARCVCSAVVMLQ